VEADTGGVAEEGGASSGGARTGAAARGYRENEGWGRVRVRGVIKVMWLVARILKKWRFICILPSGIYIGFTVFSQQRRVRCGPFVG
jgi:hypothetical protein